MSLAFQIPRHCLIWLFIAQALVIAPHLERLPVWVVVTWVISVMWRFFIYRGRWFYPGRLVKFTLVLMSVAGIINTYGNIIGLEPAVAMLITAYLLKLLEMRNRRDILLVIFLSYFVTVTALLFNQGIPAAMYMVLSVVVISAALIALNQSAELGDLYQPLRLSATMVAQSLPLMLMMFLVFPRLEPFWSVPLPSHQAKTGMGDTMSPGLVTELAKSDALAFRVSFKGQMPPQPELYWRGLVLSQFDGRTWTPYGNDRFDSPPVNYQAQAATPYRYSVIMEPTQQPWLFTLPVAQGPNGDVNYDQEYTLGTPSPIKQRMQFEFESYLGAVREPVLYERRRQRELRLPAGFNPQARRLARQWRREAASDVDVVQAALQHFREKPFFYTLQPPGLGLHSVDEFLFSTRRGFCEHYASSFTFLMRAAGVPARVVVGYQGGSKNDYQDYVVVRQMDAHAWAEVWFDEHGWVRVDPTAAVAPERIELGSEESLSKQDSFLSEAPLSPLHLRDIEWIRALQQRYDQVNFAWNRWVLNYDAQLQFKVLTELLGEVSPQRMVFAVLLGGVIAIGVVAIQLLVRQPLKHTDPVVKAYSRFCRKFTKLGVIRQPGEAPRSFALRAGEKRPDLRGEIQVITGLYEQMQYVDNSFDKSKFRKLKKLINAMTISKVRLYRQKK